MVISRHPQKKFNLRESLEPCKPQLPESIGYADRWIKGMQCKAKILLLSHKKIPRPLCWPSHVQSQSNKILSSCRLFPHLGIRCQFIRIGARSRIYRPAASAEALSRARVLVVQHPCAARAHHPSRTWSQAAVSAVKSVWQVLYLEMNPSFFKTCV